MAQSPLKVDVLQIDSSSGFTLTVSRDSSTGEMKFLDPVHPLGLVLSQLVGIQNIQGCLVVGKTEAPYSTIQSALDAVPNTASRTNPYLVLVLPGVYTEDVRIVKDGIIIQGMGMPTVQSALDATPDAVGNTHTISIAASGATIPLNVVLNNLVIQNSHTNKSCVNVAGSLIPVSLIPQRVASSTVGSGSLGIRIENCDLRAYSASSNYSVQAVAVNNVVVRNCRVISNQLDILQFDDVAQGSIESCTGLSCLDISWNNAHTLPLNAPTGYTVRDIQVAGTTLPVAVNVALAGAQTFLAQSCGLPDVTLGGDQTITFQGCKMDALTVNGTPTVALYNSTRTTINVNALASLSEATQHGIVSFTASNSEATTLDIPGPDALYRIVYEMNQAGAGGEVPFCAAKLSTGFTTQFTSAQTLDVEWTLLR